MRTPILLFLLAALALVPPAHGHGRHDGVPGVSRPHATLKVAATLRGAAGSAPARLYIANDDHTDYMWTGNEADYQGAFLTMLDYYMAQAETTAWRAADFRGRFNTDGTLWLRVFENNRSPAEVQRLMDHIRAGNITVPLNTCVQLYGAMPAEAVIRSFSYAGRIERRENLRFPLVVPMENQTLPGGVGSLWAGCGAKYSWKGICDCSTEINSWDRPREVYHFTGPDGQSVLMKWNSMTNGNRSLGGYAEAFDPEEVIFRMTSDSEFLERWPWSAAGAFGYGWDQLQTTTHDFIDAAVAYSDATTRVIVSNEVDFFEDLEAAHGGQIDSWGGAFGNEWDLYTASLGEVTARMKRGIEGLRTAEALAALAVRWDPAVWSSLAASRDSAMLACGLYYEHSFAPGPGVTEGERADWERRIEASLTGYVSTLRSSSAAAVGARIAGAPGVERHVVFNPLSWTRDDAADLDAVTPAPRHVVDVTTGLTLPSQTVTGDGTQRLRVMVSGVPPVGYRVLEVRPGAGTSFTPAGTVTLPSFDNGLVRVTLGTRGQITSLVDHGMGDREFVLAGSSLNDIGVPAGAGTVAVENLGPVSITLRVVAPAPRHRETRVTLYRNSRRVDVRNEFLENFGDDQGYDSRFALPGMTMRHEEVGMIARVGRLSQGGDYANENTRTDGLTLGHFVDLSQAAAGVTVSAWDSQFFRAGASTVDVLDATTPTVRLIIGNQVDGAGAGITDQGEDSYFLNRFAYGTHGAWDPVAAMRFSLEHQNPLATFPVTGSASAELPGTNYSLLTIDAPAAILWALKPAEEGASQGLVARMWNVAESPSSATLALPSTGIAQAWNTTHIETDLGVAPLANHQLPMTFERQQLRTFRLFPGSTTSTEPQVPTPGTALAIWPSPARSSGQALTIAFTQFRGGNARLAIVDITGARVATLLDGASDPGRHELRWVPDRSGRAVRPGIYFVQLETPDGAFRGRIVMLDR